VLPTTAHPPEQTGATDASRPFELQELHGYGFSLLTAHGQDINTGHGPTSRRRCTRESFYSDRSLTMNYFGIAL